jgi:L-ribulokinase
MAIVAGVDFGTLSVRVTLVDTVRGRLGSGTAEYPLQRRKDDPDYVTQSHDDHMRGLVDAMPRALDAAKIRGDQVASLAVDTTGSSVIPVGETLQPLDEYYLWCDHRSWREAALITKTAHEKDQNSVCFVVN